MSVGYVVEIHVVKIPDEIVRPDRLAKGYRAVMINHRGDAGGILLVLECPHADEHWHVRINSMEDRAEEIEAYLAARERAPSTVTDNDTDTDVPPEEWH